MEVRQATAEEIPYLKQRLAETDGEQVDLDTARIFVAVDGNEIIGMLPLRLVWQAEPLLVFPEAQNKHKRRRCGVRLYIAATTWLADRTQNKTGIHWLFGITRSRAVAGWLDKLGWLRQYVGAQTFIKYF